MKMAGYDPVIIGFLCNWCSYTGADLAGVIRCQYPPNLRPIRVMCSGMVSPDLVMEAFENGADGVMILGCHPGECHYFDGNIKCEARAQAIRFVLKHKGVESQRLNVDWVSSAEGSVFAQKVTRFTSMIVKLGPYPRTR